MQINQKKVEIIPWSCDKLSFIQRSIEKFLGKWTNYLQKIEEKIYDFLKEYDENQDGRIEVSELKIDKFAWDLQKEMINYRL